MPSPPYDEPRILDNQRLQSWEPRDDLDLLHDPDFLDGFLVGMEFSSLPFEDNDAHMLRRAEDCPDVWLPETPPNTSTGKASDSKDPRVDID